MSDCKLCNGNFDFRKVQINEILGEIGITFTPRLNEITEESMFKFCPLCGRELTDKEFKEKRGIIYVLGISNYSR